MYMNLDVLQMSLALAAHAEQRQTIVANNVANADTHGYRAKDLKPFSDTFRQNQAAFQMRATRPSHLHSLPRNLAPRTTFSGSERAPNGNTVSLPVEMAKAAVVRQQHEMALGIYQKSMNILRTSLGL